MLYNNLSSYLKAKYGKRLSKICIDGGFSCPNRDGACGHGGCIFCGERGAGEHIDPAKSIRRQVEDALARSKGDEGYIDVTLKIEKNTADIEVTMRDFFDDYFEVEEDESAGSIDDVAWTFMQEPFIGGPIYAMSRFKFQTKEELFETLADRMSCFSNPEFIKALTLDH